MKIYFYCFGLFGLLLVKTGLYANDCQTYPALAELPVQAIVWQGLVKTSKDSLQQKLKTQENQPFSLLDWEEDRQFLLESGLFSQLNCSFSNLDNKVFLAIQVKEKWTSLPIVKFASGGGTSLLTLGAYDPNFRGGVRELGGQLEKLGSSLSYVLWWREKGFFHPDLSLFLQSWSVNRLRLKYRQEQDQVQLKAAFLQTRQKNQIDLNYRWSTKQQSSILLDWNQDHFSRRFLSGETLELSQASQLPPSTETLSLGIAHRFGQVRELELGATGVDWQGSSRWVKLLKGDLPDFHQSDWQARLFLPVTEKLVWAHNFKMGLSDTEVLQFWYYLGGLDSIRGFRDNRFAARNFALWNSEFRWMVYHSSDLRIQTNSFFDLVSVAESWQELDDLDGASVGIGLRFLVPQIYRFVARIDFAKPIKGEDDQILGLGVQQFF